MPATLLTTAVNRLERVVLRNTYLTDQQKVGIFTAAAASFRCCYLDLSQWGFSGESVAAVTQLKTNLGSELTVALPAMC